MTTLQPPRRSGFVWAAIIVPMWATLACCAAWGPIVFDAWSVYIGQRTAPITAARVMEFAHYSYTRGNPRVGQLLCLLLYTPGPWNIVLTPLVAMTLFYLATTLVLGRWPSLRRSDDAASFLVTTALIVVTLPRLGPMFFYGPFLSNYIFPVAIDLALLVPFRFALDRAPRARGPFVQVVLAIAMMALGAIAGLCNEHTGIALTAVLIATAWSTARRDRAIAPWMIAAIVGLLAGYAALLLAPGQHVRYGGLADHQTLLERVVARGALGNVMVLGWLAVHAAVAVPLCALGWIGRARGATTPLPRTTYYASCGLAGAAVLAAFTLLASPKLGERLYAASTVWIAIAIAPWLLARTAVAPLPRIRDAVCAAVLIVVAASCMCAYRDLGRASAQRIAILQRAAPGSRVVVPPWPRANPWWSLGDDLVDPKHRELLAHRLGLSAIDLAPPR